MKGIDVGTEMAEIYLVQLVHICFQVDLVLNVYKHMKRNGQTGKGIPGSVGKSLCLAFICFAYSSNKGIFFNIPNFQEFLSGRKN